MSETIQNEKNLKKIGWPFFIKNKIGPFGKKKVFETKSDYLKEMEEELLKEKPNKTKILNKLYSIQKNEPDKGIYYRKPNDPLLFLLKNRGKSAMYENVIGGGSIQITRSDDKEAFINLPLSRLQSMEYGEHDAIKFWVAHENNAVAYPYHKKHDSRILKQIISGIMINHNNLDVADLKEKTKMIQAIFVGIAMILVIVFVVAPLFGVNVFEMIAKASATVPVETVTNAPVTGGI